MTYLKPQTSIQKIHAQYQDVKISGRNFLFEKKTERLSLTLIYFWMIWSF